MQAEIDTACRSIPGFVAGVIARFFFYNRRTFFNEYNLLGRDEICLPRRNRRIFTRRLADLVNCALN